MGRFYSQTVKHMVAEVDNKLGVNKPFHDRVGILFKITFLAKNFGQTFFNGVFDIAIL
jgi:ABC-type microcin C transport system permease subunit YejB